MFRDGVLVAAISEERLSRLKSDGNRLPALADQLRGAVGPWAAVIAIAIVVGVLMLFLRLDYRTLFEEHRLRWNFKRRRDEDMPGGA